MFSTALHNVPGKAKAIASSGTELRPSDLESRSDFFMLVN